MGHGPYNLTQNAQGITIDTKLHQCYLWLTLNLFLVLVVLRFVVLTTIWVPT